MAGEDTLQGGTSNEMSDKAAAIGPSVNPWKDDLRKRKNLERRLMTQPENQAAIKTVL